MQAAVEAVKQNRNITNRKITNQVIIGENPYLKNM